MKKYIVREGETLRSISETTGIRLSLLMAANPQVHDADTPIRTGNIISLPELSKPDASTHGSSASGTSGTGSYFPKAMDDSSTSTSLSHGASSMDAPAQSTPGPAPGYFGFVWPHVVQRGDTWESLSRRYQVPLSELRQFNPALGMTIREGDLVYVPSSAEGKAMPGSAKAVPGSGYGAPGVQPDVGTGMPPLSSAQGMPGVGVPGQAEEPFGPHTHYPYRPDDAVAPETPYAEWSPYGLVPNYNYPEWRSAEPNPVTQAAPREHADAGPTKPVRWREALSYPIQFVDERVSDTPRPPRPVATKKSNHRSGSRNG